MEKYYLKKWTLCYDKKRIPSTVPGDITIDLYRANLIDNPYFGMNYKESTWIPERDFTYEYELDVKEELLSNESIEIVFKGIDLFSDIYVNDTHLAATENMWITYRFEIKELLKVGKNTIRVEMHSTLEKAKTFDTTGYEGCFNKERVFLRKAQCHFGWDWAPKICAYGLWDDVYLEVGSKYKIRDVRYIAYLDGNVSFDVELNYNIRAQYAPGGVIAVPAEEFLDDTLVYYLSTTPNGDKYISHEVVVTGKKNCSGMKLDNPELWWPHDYGKQPLYNYKVELYRDGKLVHTYAGKVAFRKVELVEEGKAPGILGFEFKINDKKIFIKGANWVPVECFTGVVEDDKYRRLVEMAVQGNFNLLRVWGGGIYEKDIFYDLCDEMGVLVWQDFMTACADIAEDKPDWVSNMISEVEFEIKRLRNHPSLIYWCGGNEKTGTYGLLISRGDFFVNYTLAGIVHHLDGTRPYRRQSPFSHTDVGNDRTSGETHFNCCETALNEGVRKYRELLVKQVVPFSSECAIMGPNSLETTKKIFPKENLWPMDYMWNDRLMENPYAAIKIDFAHREQYYASELYGECKGLVDFTAKGALAHAEMMRAEIEMNRSNKGITSGISCWMYSDIWPSGTWSVIDYWCEPKQVYYAMKKAFAPVLATFIQNKNDETELVVVNDTYESYSSDVVVEVRSFAKPKLLYTDVIKVENLVNDKFKAVIPYKTKAKDVYCVCRYKVNGEDKVSIWSYSFFADTKFKSDYEVSASRINAHKYILTISANKFAKSVYLTFKDNFKYNYSDNYVDVLPGEKVSITITSKETINLDNLVITDFARETEVKSKKK